MLNVSTLSIEKQHFVIDLMGEKNINILGLSETSLLIRESSHVYKNNTNDFISYFTNSEDFRGSGTGILITKELNKHVFNRYEFKGRIILLDMAFKGNLKLCLIQCYLPGKQHSDLIINEYHTEIKRLIGEAKNRKYEIILMGDFNLYYDTYLLRKNQG